MPDDVTITITDGDAVLAGTSDLYDLLPRVIIETPNCPDAVQRLALRLAARTFCQDTYVWRETLTTTSVAADATYDLNALHSYDATVFLPVSTKLSDAEVVSSFGTTGILTFDSAPATAGLAISVEAVMVPDDTCDRLPTWLMSVWSDGILAQALYWLQIQAKKPWTDREGAAVRQKEYAYHCGRAKESVLTERVGGDLRVIWPALV